MKKQQHKDTAMEVVDDVCESEGVCEVLCHVPSDQPEEEESMEMHVSEEEVAHMAKSASTGEHADLSAAAHGTVYSSTESQKPRYSYRLVWHNVVKARFWKQLSKPFWKYFMVNSLNLSQIVSHKVICQSSYRKKVKSVLNSGKRLFLSFMHNFV